jgi:YbbR domain-containing protein
VPLEVNDKEPNTTIIGQIPNQVNVTLYAPSSRISMIERRISPLTAKISLKGLNSGKHSIPVQVFYEIRPARLIRVEPAEISLEIERIVEQVMPIQLYVIGKPALGFEAGQAELMTKEAKVTGPESLVKKIAELKATADINGKEELIEEEVPLQAIDATGSPVSGVDISPKTVMFRQPINLLKGYRSKVVRVITTGTLAEGYRLEDILVYPLKVLLFSDDPAILDKMPGYVETEPLNLNKANKDIDTRLTLQLPAGVSVVGDQTVRVRVRLSAIESSLAFKLPVEVIGLNPQYTVALPVDTVDVFLAGPLPVLSNLQGKDVRVLIDLTDLGIGKHQVTPQVDILPSDVRMLSISPPTLDIVIQPPLNIPRNTQPTATTSPESQQTSAPTKKATPTPTIPLLPKLGAP